MEKSNIKTDIQTLLRVQINNDASDLHIVSRSAPQIRIDGKLVPLDMPNLTGTDIEHLCYAIITDAQKSELEEKDRKSVV